MDLNVIMEALGSGFFPIAMCAVLFWKMEKDDARHKDDIERMTDALNNNTQALVRLEEKLKGV